MCVCETVCAANGAFVSSEDLPLSQRHEQAKRLLERAHMKARSCPLKADHTILPIQRDNPEQLSMAGAPFRRAPLAGKGGVSSAIVAAVTSSGNLSDSSSGDSACCPHRRPGQSPTRVRFEDESEKDAEVRYLERLRQRRAAHGLLKSKPNLSSYVNGWMDTDPGTGIEQGRCLEGSFLWHKKARRTQEGYVNRGSRGHFKAAVAQEALNRQCNSCGTFLEGGVPNLNLHLNPSPPKGQNGPVNGEGKGKLLMSCWVAPSEPSQAVLTELIKETYIGKVTLRDVADSTGTWRGWAGETDSSSGSVRMSTMKVKRRSRRGEILETNGHGAPITVPSTPPRSNHSLAPVSSTNGIVVVPPNPYTIEKPVSMVVGLHTHSPAPPEEPTNCPPCLKGTPFPPSSLPIKPALKTGPKTRPNGQLSVKHVPSPQYRILTQDSLEDQGRGAAPSPQNEHSVGGNFKEVGLSLGLTSSTIMPCIRPASLLKTSPSPAKIAEEKLVHPAPQTPEVELQHPWMGGANIITPPPYHSGCDGQVMGPMRTKHQREDSTSPAKMVGTETTEQQEARSKLSLRRLFSAISLNGVAKCGTTGCATGSQTPISKYHSPSETSSPAFSTTVQLK
uniref:DUF4685 domain-containing protein n=1 Tax=Hucho hucho TaxID=62062 RepID=A0A4W5P7Q3_9TELE